MEREKKARALAEAEKKRARRIRDLKDKRADTQALKYKRGRLLLAVVLDWLRMFLECFEKDDTGMYWMKPDIGEQLQTMLIAMEIILPETTAIFKFQKRSEKDNEADALRHAFFVCMLETAKSWMHHEERINALLQSGSISPSDATQMLESLRQQALKRFRFYPEAKQSSPHQNS